MECMHKGEWYHQKVLLDAGCKNSPVTDNHYEFATRFVKEVTAHPFYNFAFPYDDGKSNLTIASLVYEGNVYYAITLRHSVKGEYCTYLRTEKKLKSFVVCVLKYFR